MVEDTQIEGFEKVNFPKWKEINSKIPKQHLSDFLSIFHFLNGFSDILEIKSPSLCQLEYELTSDRTSVNFQIIYSSMLEQILADVPNKPIFISEQERKRKKNPNINTSLEKSRIQEDEKDLSNNSLFLDKSRNDDENISKDLSLMMSDKEDEKEEDKKDLSQNESINTSKTLEEDERTLLSCWTSTPRLLNNAFTWMEIFRRHIIFDMIDLPSYFDSTNLLQQLEVGDFDQVSLENRILILNFFISKLLQTKLFQKIINQSYEKLKSAEKDRFQGLQEIRDNFKEEKKYQNSSEYKKFKKELKEEIEVVKADIKETEEEK